MEDLPRGEQGDRLRQQRQLDPNPLTVVLPNREASVTDPTERKDAFSKVSLLRTRAVGHDLRGLPVVEQCRATPTGAVGGSWG
jgi:hypothetical protein